MKKQRPWEKLETETAKAYESFVEYRQMGVNRSNAKVAQKLGKPKSLIDRWSRKHQWQKRIGAYDAEIASHEAMTEIETFKKMNERHIRLAAKAQLIVNRYWDALAKKPKKIPELKVTEMSTLMRCATELERKAHGLDDGRGTQQIIVAASGSQVGVLNITMNDAARFVMKALRPEKPEIRKRVLRRLTDGFNIEPDERKF